MRGDLSRLGAHWRRLYDGISKRFGVMFNLNEVLKLSDEMAADDVKEAEFNFGQTWHDAVAHCSALPGLPPAKPLKVTNASGYR